MKGIMWINLLLGLWLVVTPFAMASGTIVATNDVILGILLIACSWWMLAAMAPPVGVAWFEILCGIWLIVSPYVLGVSAMHATTGNDVIAGIIAIVVALVAARTVAHTPTAA
jgi:hypothetical protein